MPDQLHVFDLAEVNSAVAATEFAGSRKYFSTGPSTNGLAYEAAKAGARHGVWIAGEQTAGRGRGAHTWHSAAGNGLYMTALTAPPIPMQSAQRLSLTVAIAVQAAIASATEPATLRYAIIGIGINLNHLTFPPDIEAIATSLRRELSGPALPNAPILRREPLATAILLALDAELRRLTANLEPRTSNPSRYSTWLNGKRVRVEARDGAPSYTGTTTGLDEQGFLRILGDDGQPHTILSG